MEVKLTGTAEEIAALVLQLQGRPGGQLYFAGTGRKISRRRETSRSDRNQGVLRSN